VRPVCSDSESQVHPVNLSFFTHQIMFRMVFQAGVTRGLELIILVSFPLVVLLKLVIGYEEIKNSSSEILPGKKRDPAFCFPPDEEAVGLTLL
jgi:hypothetical protein